MGFALNEVSWRCCLSACNWNNSLLLCVNRWPFILKTLWKTSGLISYVLNYLFSSCLTAKAAITDEEKEAVKGVLPSLMLTLERPLQKNVCAALNIISNFDFPEKWTNLLPVRLCFDWMARYVPLTLQDLVEKLKTTDFNVINGVLKTVDSIFKRFRDSYEADAVQMTHLKYALESFTSPFLFMFKVCVTERTR